MIYAESVDRLVDNAGETGPTVLSAWPRVYEKAFNNVVANGMAQKGLSGTLFSHGHARVRDVYAKAKDKGHAYSSFAFGLARKLVFPKIKEKAVQALSAGASTPSSPAALRWRRRSPTSFDLLGFDLLEVPGSPRPSRADQRQPARQNKLGPPRWEGPFPWRPR